MNPEGESQVFLNQSPQICFREFCVCFGTPQSDISKLEIYIFLFCGIASTKKKTLITMSHFVETGVLFSNGNTLK